jgi:hypothetical protein
MSADSKIKKDVDIFIASSTYPDAQSLFTTRLKPLEEIKSDCIVVLDTNALLVPYTTSKEGLEQIRRTYKALVSEKRLVVPGQVAREFAKNRANKISELYQQLSAKRDNAPAIKKGTYPLLESVVEYQKSLQIEDDINKLLREYSEAINNVLDYIRRWVWDDPVSLLYGELFTADAILDLSFNKDEVAKELARRKLHSVPPGYKDEGVGDLLIWLTILEIGKTHKRSVIFVSGDEKADWYHISNKQPLYPRFELVDEYRRNSDGQSFHIVRLSTLLALSGVSQEVVDEVKREELTTFASGFIDEMDSGGQISLIGGSLVVRGISGGPKFHFIAPGFSISNGGSDPGNVEAQRCSPCRAGERISLNSKFAGDLGLGSGPAKIRGREYPRLYYAGLIEFYGEIETEEDESPRVVISGEFTFSGFMKGFERNPYVGDPGDAVFDVRLRGSGTATVELLGNLDPAHGRLYFFNSITYKFDPKES